MEILVLPSEISESIKGFTHNPCLFAAIPAIIGYQSDNIASNKNICCLTWYLPQRVEADTYMNKIKLYLHDTYLMLRIICEHEYNRHISIGLQVSDILDLKDHFTFAAAYANTGDHTVLTDRRWS